MKNLIALLLLLCALSTFAQVSRSNAPPNVTLAWDASPSTGLSLYKVYWGAASATYTNVVPTGWTNLTLTVSNLVRGSTYYFAATATGTNGLESPYSTELVYLFPALPTAPANLRISP